jgi:hypothetical protein
LSKPYVETATASPTPGARARPRSLTPLVLVLLACLAPVVAAVVMYLNPQWLSGKSTNYGDILEPQRPVPPASELALTDLQGNPVDLQQMSGQWLLLTADGAACPEECARKLFIMRQSHASTGKNVVRIDRVWLITDDAPVKPEVLEAYRGMHMLRANPEQLRAFLGSDTPEKHIWIIDPLNNLMMRFPENADPSKLRRDIGKLLFASQVG